TRGAILLRAGKVAEAEELLSPSQEALPLHYLALARQHQGNTAQADKAMQQAADWLAAPSKINPKVTNEASLGWESRLEIELVKREIARLRGGGPAKTP